MGPTKVVTIKGIEYESWQWDGSDIKTLDLPAPFQKVVRAYTFGSNAYSSHNGRSGARLYLRTIKRPVQDVMLWPGDWALARRTPGGKPFDQLFSLPNSTFIKAIESVNMKKPE